MADDKPLRKDLFGWSPRFGTGLPLVDAEHAGLLSLVNRLARVIDDSPTPRRLADLIDELETHAREHFLTEETLMRGAGVDPASLTEHLAAHQELCDDIAALRTRLDGSKRDLREALTSLLPVIMRWLIGHLMGADLRMTRELQALRDGQPPQEARRKASADEPGTLAAALEVLGELNDALIRQSADLAEANERLRASDEIHTLAQRVARIGTWEMDLSQFSLLGSAEFQRLFGRHPDMPVRDLDELINCVPEADRQAIFDALARVLHGDACFTVEHRVLLADGGERWLNPIAERIAGDADRGDRLVGVVRDITSEHLARQRMHDTNQQLSLSLAALERHAADLTRLNELNESLQGCLSAGDAFEVVQHALARLNLGRGGSLSVPEGNGETMQVVASWGAGAQMSSQFLASGCWGLRRGKRHIVHGPEDGPRCRHFDDAMQDGYMCLPLQVLGEPLGLLTMQAAAGTGEAEWSRLLHLANMIAESLKLALSNVRLREALHEQATRDPLTGLLNRRYLDEALPRELARARREQRPLCLVMLDLDHFKCINDSFGHEAGDAVLSQLSALLRTHLRRSDLACRFGGEEFVVLMPGASLTEAMDRIGQILGEVRGALFHIGHTHLPPVSFSAGIAEAPRHGDAPEQLLRVADRALYAAKEAGRNCIRLGELLPTET